MLDDILAVTKLFNFEYKSEYNVADATLLDNDNMYSYDCDVYVIKDADVCNKFWILDDKLLKNKTLEVYSKLYAPLVAVLFITEVYKDDNDSDTLADVAL